MNRQQALQTLSENRSQLKRFSFKDLYLFGSVARDEAIDASDVDILVEFQPDAKIGYNFMGVPYIPYIQCD